jgi:hypothetical protein
MKKTVFFFLIFLFSCQKTEVNQNQAILQSCECTLKSHYKDTKPWDLPWKDNEAMKDRFEDCVCKLDISKVENFNSLLKPDSLIVK